MKKNLLFIIFMLCFSQFLMSQSDSSLDSNNIFTRITAGMSNFKIDTSYPPHDKITAKIIELRSMRGGFNINEAIEFKIAEDSQNKKMTEKETNDSKAFFNSGNGKRKLDNAVIWIYRNRFSYNDLKKMVKFYRTSAGQKMASDFPIIMLQSLAAAETIKNDFGKSIQ
ncbi:MAG: DUF2059 domain-containing protein [Flavisolibacter sp.]